MSFLEEARWKGFFALDALKGGKALKAYRSMDEAYRYGTSRHDTEKKLRAIIGEAVKNTGFYSKFPADAALEDLPVVNKDIYRERYDEFLSKAYENKKGCRVMSTSGSTGTPFSVVQDPGKIACDQAGGAFLGALAGYRIGMRMAFLRVWVSNVKKSRLRLFAENMIMADTSDLSDEGIKKLLAMFRDEGVKAVVGYASALTEISRYMERTGADGTPLGLCAIIPISESMPSAVREKLQEQFGCPVMSWYSNEENGIMGVQRPGSEEYYIDTSSYVYEILKPDEDVPVKPGEVGRVVITDLNNKAFPMLRYDTGDMAREHLQVSGERYRLYLSEIFGRRSDTIYDVNGNALSSYVITNNLWNIEGVKQYRFIQLDETHYELRLNTGGKKADENEILGRILKYFGEGAKIDIVYVDEIPVLASGKRKHVENRCEKYVGGRR